MDSDAGKRQRGKRSSGRLPEKQAGLSLVPELARLLENVDTRMTSEIMTGQRRVYARLCESMTAGELRSTQGLCNFFFFARGCFLTLAVAGYRKAAGCLGGVPRGTFTTECLVFLLLLWTRQRPYSLYENLRRPTPVPLQPYRKAAPKGRA